MATPTLDCACRVQISAVGIVTSLKPCVPLESTTIVAKNWVVLEAPTQPKDWPIRDLPWRGYPFMHYMYTNNYTAELRRSFAKALVRHNGSKNAVPSWLLPVSHSSLRRLAKAPYCQICRYAGPITFFALRQIPKIFKEFIDLFKIQVTC